MKVLVVGANGKVGTLLCGKLWGAHDFSPVALIRDHRQQTKFTAIGVPAVTGDLEEGVAKYLAGLMQWFLRLVQVRRLVRIKRRMSIRMQRSG